MPVLHEPEWAANVASGCPWLNRSEQMEWVNATERAWRLDEKFGRLFHAPGLSALTRWEHAVRILAFAGGHSYSPQAAPGRTVVAVRNPDDVRNIDLVVLSDRLRSDAQWLPHSRASEVDEAGCGIGRSRLPLYSEGWYGGVEGVRRPLGLAYRLFDGLRRADMRDRRWVLDGRRVRYGDPGSNDLRNSMELRAIRPHISATLHPSDDGTCVSAYGEGRVGWALYVFAEHMRAQPAVGS